MSPPRRSPRPCRRPRGSRGAGRSAPRMIDNVLSHRAIGAHECGANHVRLRTWGNPQECEPQHHAVAEKNKKPLCRAKREPPRGAPPGAAGQHAAGARQGQARASGQQHTRPHDPPNRPQDDEGSPSTARRDMRREPRLRAHATAPAGGGRFRKPPSRGRPTPCTMLKAEGSAQPRGARNEPRVTRGQGAASARNEQGRRAPPSVSSIIDGGFLA